MRTRYQENGAKRSPGNRRWRIIEVLYQRMIVLYICEDNLSSRPSPWSFSQVIVVSLPIVAMVFAKISSIVRVEVVVVVVARDHAIATGALWCEGLLLNILIMLFMIRGHATPTGTLWSERDPRNRQYSHQSRV